jgi:hypothetical protein
LGTPASSSSSAALLDDRIVCIVARAAEKAGCVWTEIER